MLLLHISDIHFRVQDLGPVGAILVGGDIAFKGDPEEYKAVMGA